MAAAAASSNPKYSLKEFQTFFDGWLVRQEHFLEELQDIFDICHESKEDDLKELCGRVFGHYQEYYGEKSRMCSSNVFIVFNPPWFTPFERTFFWIAGFKPDLAFRMAALAAPDMTPDQKQRMQQLKYDTRVVETQLNAELSRVHENVASQELMTAAADFPTGEEINTDTVMEDLQNDMVALILNADVLRTKTAEQVAEILNPVQTVKFLAGATQLYLRVRSTGLEREEEKGNQE